MKNKFLKISSLAVISLIFSFCKKNTEETQIVKLDSIDSVIYLNSAGLYPEGLDFDMNNKRFVLGSFKNGNIKTISLDGKLSDFIEDSNLVAVTGVNADEDRNRLIVVSGDAGVSKKSTSTSAGSKAYIGIYNLSTGALIKSIDLKSLTPNAGAFPNDIAVDNNGNIYITDSFSPIVYLVNNTYNASVFVTSDLFVPASGSFGLNGIVYHSDGYLIVAKTDNNKYFKISINNPSDNIKEITGITAKTPDGLEFTKDNKLVIVENGLSDGKVYTYFSSDNWSSALSTNKDVTIGKDEFPTTASLASNDKVYVIASKLGKLFGGDTTQSSFRLKSIN